MDRGQLGNVPLTPMHMFRREFCERDGPLGSNPEQPAPSAHLRRQGRFYGTRMRRHLRLRRSMGSCAASSRVASARAASCTRRTAAFSSASSAAAQGMHRETR